MFKMKILLIDKDENFFKNIKKTFKNVNFTFFLNPIEAIIHLKNEKYDLIILDIFSTNISGIKILEKIKNLNLPSKVIVMTSIIEENIRRICILNGCNFFLQKNELGITTLKKITDSYYLPI